jgi:Berberine and berberine like
MTDSGNAAGDPAAEAGDRLALELRDSWASTSGYPEFSVYINYARGDETLEQRYGRNKLPRLMALKKKWDPDNVFAYNNALPTE